MGDVDDTDWSWVTISLTDFENIVAYKKVW